MKFIKADALLKLRVLAIAFFLLIMLNAGAIRNVLAQGDEIRIINDNGVEYVVHIYTSTGTMSFSPPSGVSELDILVVGGGGGGGGGLGGDAGNSGGGGGGAGGLIFRPGLSVGSLTFPVTVTVGEGGAPRLNGEASVFAHLTALGGGAGGGNTLVSGRAGSPGGSGGGGGHNFNTAWSGGAGQQPVQAGESGQYGYGNAGGFKVASPGVPAAGGGGAGEQGTEGGTNASTAAGGNGLHQVVIGAETFNLASVFGTGYGELLDGEIWFAGGGGGDRWDTSPPEWTGAGGKGGGGNGADNGGTATPGLANTGGGGGGADGRNTAEEQNGTNGGSGIVMIRYAASSIGNGPSTLSATKITLETDIAIDSGTFITFEAGELNHNSNSIIIESGGLFNNQTGDNGVNLIMKRKFTENAPGWRYLTSPVGGTIGQLLEGIWTQGSGAGYNSESDPANFSVFSWPASVGDRDIDDDDERNIDRATWETVDAIETRTIQTGEGFLVYYFALDGIDPPDAPADGTELEISGQENVDHSFEDLNTTDNGWTLVGNPYATAIDFNQLQAGTNITGSVYVWNPADPEGVGEEPPSGMDPIGSWKTWNGSIGDLAGGVIPPFQAFFVQQDGTAGGSLSFSNSVKSGNIHAGNFNFRHAPHDIYRIELTGQGMRNSTWLKVSGDGSFDRRIPGDAYQLYPHSNDYALLATRKRNGDLFDIGHFPLTDSDDHQAQSYQIPLVYEVTRPGEYTLRVTEMGLASGIPLYLTDLEENLIFRLNENLSYVFTVSDVWEKSVAKDPFTNINRPLRKVADASSSRFIISNIIKDDVSAEELSIPLKLTLNQNHPNPFNPSTVIAYTLPEQSKVMLTIYDMLGRPVAVLVNETQGAGSYEILWDAGLLSSGTYIYRLNAGRETITRRMTLVK